MKKTSINKKTNKTFNIRGLIIGLAITLIFLHHDATATQAPVPLGSAGTFAVLAATTVTSAGATIINGDLGVGPGGGVTGAPTVNGTTHLADPIAAQAQNDLTVAYNDAAGRSLGAVLVAGNIGGQTLAPGLYKSSSSLEITSGDLSLDAQGDPNAVWIIQMASTLVTTVGRQVFLINGAKACNVFWQVGSSATLGGSSVFKGNILAYTSIGLDSSASLEGRALAQHGAVTLNTNSVTISSCQIVATVLLVSGAVVNGPYTDAAGRSVNLVTKTITVPKSGSMQYYRIRSGTVLNITSTSLSGGNVVITYN